MIHIELEAIKTNAYSSERTVENRVNTDKCIPIAHERNRGSLRDMRHIDDLENTK